MRTFWLLLSFLVLIFIVWLIVAGVRSAQETPSKNNPVEIENRQNTTNTTNTPGQSSVNISNAGFSPATMEVTRGTAVTWTNNDQAPHTVTSDTNLFDSGRLQTGESYSFTFNELGQFPYKSMLDPQMKGLIVVK